MIVIQNLSASFGSFLLQNISLRLERGRTLVILGPSGAGKTMLLEAVMGVRAPKTGRVYINGQDVSSLPPEARRISYIPQDIALFPHLGVRANILFGLQSRSSQTADAPQIDWLIDRLGLGPLINREDVASLSGGEQQRVALARALVVEPQVLFLDEPFSALDRLNRLDVVELLRAVKQRLGTTVVHVTHDFEEASALADDIAIVQEGQIVQHGERDAVFSRPANRSIAIFLLVKNILPADTLPLEFPSGNRRPQWVGIRPEEVVLLSEADDRSNCFETRVEEAIPLHGRWSVRLAVREGLTLEAFVSANQFRILRPEPGHRLVAHLPPEAIICLEEKGQAEAIMSGGQRASQPEPARQKE